MKMKKEKFFAIVSVASTLMNFTACSDIQTIENADLSESTSTVTTEAISEEAVVTGTDPIQDESSEETITTEAIPIQNEASDNAENAAEALTSEAIRLMGALDEIDQIGGGNMPKDENDIFEIDSRQYARVNAQFENTADLETYMEENLSDSLIQNRYSHILGGEQPYYMDVDGALYGYVTAKACGYSWIMENGAPVVSIVEENENSFTAVTKFDHFGGECEMELYIVSDNESWKIDSISYDGQSF